MFKIDTAAADSALVVAGYPYETPRTPWRVSSVEPLDDYQLRVVFRDGLSGLVQMRDQICREDSGVFRSLEDPAVFADVSVVFGAVTWGNGVDLAPDAMYEAIKRDGVWVLR